MRQAARRLAATSPGTPTPQDAMKEDAPASNGANGKGVIKGDGVPAIDQATLESIDHRRGEYTKGSREYASYLCFAIAALHCAGERERKNMHASAAYVTADSVVHT